jgi:hypothetical protein
MKGIIREYLASLREREELDAMLPELLSALGYTVYSRPQIGGRQYGVDVAALSPPDGAGDVRVCLFSVKKGDLTRQEWNGNSTQALRPSLDEIIDAYIPTRIPPQYKDHKVTICLCFGGDIVEQVRQEVTGYIDRYTTPMLSFEEWNGDRIAGHLVDGVLSEELAPAGARAHFRKAVALLDEPDAAYGHFQKLVQVLMATRQQDVTARTLALRQLYVCTWVLFAWARDLGNLEAAYRTGELALLSGWELAKTEIAAGDTRKSSEAIRETFAGILQLYLTISQAFVLKFDPFVALPDALALSVNSQSPLDVNLKLFDLLGRFALFGIWQDWHRRQLDAAAEDVLEGPAAAPVSDSGEPAKAGDVAEAAEVATAKEGDEPPPVQSVDAVAVVTRRLLSLVASNPALGLPAADHGATDLGLALFCWLRSGLGAEEVDGWLEDAVGRLDFTIRTRGRYPTIGRAYQELMTEHADRSDDVFKAATAGSTLIPLLAVWTAAIGRTDLTAVLSELSQGELAHCTMQLWSPGADSEAHLYINDDSHGRALSGLRIDADGSGVIGAVERMLGSPRSLDNLSANTTGYYPIILVACRHWRLPVPPEFYIGAASRSVAARAAPPPP